VHPVHASTRQPPDRAGDARIGARRPPGGRSSPVPCAERTWRQAGSVLRALGAHGYGCPRV